jgi:mono/diheme cytochrome c family protein
MVLAWRGLALSSSIALSLAAGAGLGVGADKFYRIVDGKVDARTYNGYRRYHAGCSHCHGQDGLGSTFAPSLIGSLPSVESFRRIVRDGQSNGVAVMKGFGDDPNVIPYIDDIYAYLQARADGVLGRGRPNKLEQ